MDMLSGITIIALYPFAVAIDAIPIPVLPLVGSINVVFSFTNPASSASLIICIAIRSLMLPAGLKYSIFAKIFAFKPYFFSIFVNSNKGVFPINSVAFFTTIIFYSYLFGMFIIEHEY